VACCAVESDVVGYCRTLYNFAARSAQELSFSDNETIAVISKAFGMWWKGRLNDKASVCRASIIHVTESVGSCLEAQFC